MPADRRRLAVLLSILAVVAVAAIVRFWPGDVDQAGMTAARPGARVTARPPAAPPLTAPDVRIHVLDAEPPKPDEDVRRDLFRFRERPLPVRASEARTVAPPQAGQSGAEPDGSAPPAGPPPITMRFIGLVESAEQAQKIAILSDGRGIYQGREGDIIEGRYRILRIGVESVEMAYLDGRGRQTIRLTGS